ncbi:MAG: Hsp20/alpha crystallin family protein [Bacteroidota bacterium]|nr:Hsp20/alpha crystallin family protein [Candidatus Kapabacteria bacterium]MDW8219740.1 Hsp20/alpha crystallin family protein [Bacteroidota bacterium]
MRKFYYNIDPQDFQKFQAFAETAAERLGEFFNEFSKYSSFGSDTDMHNTKPKAIRIDLAEDDNNVYVFAELPGLAKEDVNVSITDNHILTISGNKRRLYDDSLKIIRGERNYGEFSRRITIEREIETEKISATFRDGVLTVTLPKPEPARPKTVNINIQ